MIICTCGKQFEGEGMFGDAVSHWQTERDKELEKRIARARRISGWRWTGSTTAIFWSGRRRRNSCGSSRTARDARRPAQRRRD